jgi:hypothetical protein
MRRAISGTVIAAITLCGFGFFIWRLAQKRIVASQIAPLNSLFFAEAPHLQQTIKRLPDTAICKILNEPTVQRFIKQPLSRVPARLRTAFDSFERLRCEGIFLCVAGAEWKDWLVGIRTSLDKPTARKEAAALVDQLLHAVVRELNEGGSQNSGSINDWSMIFVGDWLLVGRNERTVREAAQNAESGKGGIRSDAVFARCQKKVSADYDFLSFVRGGPTLDLFRGRAWVFPKDERNGDIQAILSTTAIDGAKFRDVIFTERQIPSAPEPLEERGLDMSSPRSVAFLTSRVGLSELWQITDRYARFSQVAETVHDYLDEARSFGIDPRQLDDLISAATILIDRTQPTGALTASLSFRVNDPSRFERLIDQVIAKKFPDTCTRIQLDGVPAFVIKEKVDSDIVFGLVGRELLISWNTKTFAELVQRLQVAENGLQKSEDYRNTSKLISTPTDLYLYVDTKTAFERSYNAVKPMLVFGAAFVPMLSDYIDSSSLPETSEISRHLTPIILSRHRVPDGIVDESVGPVTAYQALAFVLGTGFALGVLQHN